MPRYSIVIPSYNYAEFLPRAIDSALAQPEAREVLVVDDGSTDATAEVVAPYVADDRVSLLRQENSGVSAARNAGVDQTSGEYLLFLDADDRLLPDALTQFEQAIDAGGAPDFVLGGNTSLESGGSPQVSRKSCQPISTDRKANFTDYLRKKFSVATGATLIHRRVFERLRFPEQLRNNEDLVLVAQMLARHDGLSLGSPVLEVLRHPGSLRSQPRDIDAVVGALFDPEILPAEYFDLRDEFYADRCLSQFRALYLAGDQAAARAHFRLAVRTRPASAFRLSYLSKYLRSFLK